MTSSDLYRAIVPDAIDPYSWKARAESLDLQTEPKHEPQRRIVGSAPRLSVTDAGIIDNPGPQRPRVLRSQLTLTATLADCVKGFLGEQGFWSSRGPPLDTCPSGLTGPWSAE